MYNDVLWQGVPYAYFGVQWRTMADNPKVESFIVRQTYYGELWLGSAPCALKIFTTSGEESAARSTIRTLYVLQRHNTQTINLCSGCSRHTDSWPVERMLTHSHSMNWPIDLTGIIFVQEYHQTRQVDSIVKLIMIAFSLSSQTVHKR